MTSLGIVAVLKDNSENIKD